MVKIVETRSPDVLEHKHAGVVVSMQVVLDMFSARVMMGNNNFTSPFFRSPPPPLICLLWKWFLKFLTNTVLDWLGVGYVPVSIVVSINFLDVVPYLA